MKRKFFALLCIIVAIIIYFTPCVSTYADSLCKGKHNFNHYVYYSGPEVLDYLEEIPDGSKTPRYAYAHFTRDAYGVCVCGETRYLGKREVRKEKVRINYN